MGDLSPHFSAREFACRHCGQVKVAPELVRRLETLRSTIGRPLVVVSGYRCPWYNARVGGARQSYHLQGMAADLARGYATVHDALDAGFSGVGVRGTSAVHVDVRPGPAIVFPD